MFRPFHRAAAFAVVVAVLSVAGHATAQSLLASYEDTGYYDPGSVVESEMPPTPGDTPESVWDQSTQVPYCGPCCGGSCCCVDPCARWTVSAGALYLKRSNPDDVVLFSNNRDAALATETLNAGDFNFNYRPGFELGLTRHNLWHGWDLEAKFFMVDGWTDYASATTTGDTFINMRPELGLPGGFEVEGAREIDSRYTSELTSYEFNLRKRSCALPRVTWLIGFRALELDESLDTTFFDPTNVQPTSTYTVNTRNRLYGFQIGADVDLLNTCRWCLQGFAKTGVYFNAMDNDSEFNCCPGVPGAAFPAGERQDRAAFLGEAGLSLKYCINKNLKFRTDYRFMWLSGVALASDQVNDTSLLFFDGIDPNGDVFFHGGFVGFDYTW